MGRDEQDGLRAALERRFGEPIAAAPVERVPESWRALAGRASCRAFAPEPVADDLLQMLAALALAAPTKSDLQQRDIVIVDDPTLRGAIDALLTAGRLGQAWIAGAPTLLVFCGNNRRQRQIHQRRGRPFANDHLDAFFNASVDAAIALATFVIAAEAAGLGCTPISAVRNHAEAIAGLLHLPDHVFPVAGLALGWPAQATEPSMRLPLSATVHRNTFDDSRVGDAVDAYDRRRAEAQPYAVQRAADRFGTAADYGWSEDKARQYASPERADWGAFVRGTGFRLD